MTQYVSPVRMRIISGTTMMTSVNGQIDAISAEDDSVSLGIFSLNVGVGRKEFFRSLAWALQGEEEKDEIVKQQCACE